MNPKKNKRRLKSLMDATRPPPDRISIFLNHHFGTADAEWAFADGAGWYHVSEERLFRESYLMSYVTKKFFPIDNRISVHGVGEYMARAELDSGEHPEYVECWQSEVACLRDDTFDARDGEGIPIKVLKKYQTDNYFIWCDVLGEWYPRDGAIIFKYPVNYRKVSKRAVRQTHSHLFECCPHCQVLREKIDLRERDNMGYVSCTSCYTSDVLTKIIRKHDDVEYPKKIMQAHTCKRMIGRGVNRVAQDIAEEAPRLFGIELEVEIRDGCRLNRFELAQRIQKKVGEDFVMFKNDGSLRMHPRDSDLWGFEIVSAPADMETHISRWVDMEQAEGFKYLRAWDTVTCGMHVHVSRRELTLLQISRMDVFINSTKNTKFIEHVAGRSGGGERGYNRFIAKDYGDSLRADEDKYVAFNLKHEHTVEFRIFRGTVRYRHIIRNIEFCDAVCNYAHPASRSLNAMHNSEQFCAYIGNNRKRYQFLAEWMEVQGYIKTLKPKPGHVKDLVVEAEIVEHGVQTRN